LNRSVFLVSAALVAAGAFVYAPVRHHEFVNFDDAQYVRDNAAVAGGLSGRALSWALTTGHAGNWHPLTWLSHMLDVELFGLDPGLHHLTSAVLHVVNALLLFGLLLRMTGALFRSAFVAALFELHPLHVESVAWIAERKDVLSGFFFFLTLWAYLAYVRRPRGSRYALVVVLFALGLMAKPMLVTLPFVLLLLDVWPLGRTAEPFARRRLIVEKLPLVGLALASSVVTVLVQQHAGAIKGLGVLPFDRRLATAVLAYVTYAARTVWPSGLAAIYPYPASSRWWPILGAIAVLAAASALALRAAPRHPYLPVGWFWYLGTLVPVLGLVQVGSQPWADRYTYIPAIGLFIIVAWGTVDLLARWPRRDLLLAAAATVVLAGCAISARTQVGYWRNSVALWEHALEVTAGNHRAESNLAHALARQGRLDEAVARYVAALRIEPDFAEAHNNLGLVLADQGKVGEAMSHYSEALRVLPDYLEAHNNLGVALMGGGRDTEAIRHFSEAVRIDPTVAVSHNNLGAACAHAGRLDAAAREFAEALRLDPGYAEAQTNLAVAHNGLGAALGDQGKGDEAIDHYVQALRLRPDLADAHANLARALAGKGRPEEATREMLEAVRLQPGDADLHYDAAVLLARAGHAAEAVPHLRIALRLAPTHAEARRALDALTTAHD
jgi:tetratricopeptide (TPR) repeat protein